MGKEGDQLAGQVDEGVMALKKTRLKYVICVYEDVRVKSIMNIMH